MASKRSSDLIIWASSSATRRWSGAGLPSSASIAFGGPFQAPLNQSTNSSISLASAGGDSGGSRLGPSAEATVFIHPGQVAPPPTQHGTERRPPPRPPAP